jgi:ribose transport system substrate-binding protein
MPKVLADPAFKDRGDLVVVAFDDFEDTLKGIRDGYIQATMVQRPTQMGIYVIEGLYALNTGGSAESIDTGITVVTMDNIDTYKGGASEEAAAAPEVLTFAVVPKITHPFYDDVLAGLEQKSKELDGVEYQWIAPPTGNPAEQVQILEDLINKGVNGIGLAPLEAASVEPVIAQATAAGIPVVTFDSDAPNSERVAYYGTDNRAAGRKQGEVMAEAIGGKGKVALVTGSLVMANLNERMEGVKEVFAEKYPDIEIVDTIATDDDFAKGLEVCEAMLRAYPDLNGVIAVSMTGSVAMPKVLADPAFKDRGDLVVVAFDDFEDTLKGIRDGYIQATMVQRPTQMGIYVIEGLYALNTGGSAESIDTGITVVTMDNIDTYK